MVETHAEERTRKAEGESQSTGRSTCFRVRIPPEVFYAIRDEAVKRKTRLATLAASTLTRAVLKGEFGK